MTKILEALDWVLSNTVGKFACYVIRRDGHSGTCVTMRREWLRDGSWIDRCKVCGHTESSRD